MADFPGFDAAANMFNMRSMGAVGANGGGGGPIAPILSIFGINLGNTEGLNILPNTQGWAQGKMVQFGGRPGKEGFVKRALADMHAKLGEGAKTPVSAIIGQGSDVGGSPFDSGFSSGLGGIGRSGGMEID